MRKLVVKVNEEESGLLWHSNAVHTRVQPYVYIKRVKQSWVVLSLYKFKPPDQMASTVTNQEPNQDDLILQQQRNIEKEVRIRVDFA